MQFAGLAMDDVVWDHSTFSKNGDRLLEHDAIVGLFNETVETAHARGYPAWSVVNAQMTQASVTMPRFRVQQEFC